jgi:putative FmdB family regulatory protein
MPVYEYQCELCWIVYETMHGMNDPPIERCPKCDTLAFDVRAEAQSVQLFQPDRGEIRQGLSRARNCQGEGSAQGL